MSERITGTGRSHWDSETGLGEDISSELRGLGIEKVYHANQPLALFQDAYVDLVDGAFRVPERVIATPRHGIWSFGVSGRVKRFKERDDRGEIRTFSSGKSIWMPYIFPFDDKDQHQLPRIVDSEWCNLEVHLEPVLAPDIYPLYTEINVGGQVYGSEQDPGCFEAVSFSEFIALGVMFSPEEVRYPEARWNSLFEYLVEEGRAEDYFAILSNELEFPVEYAAHDKPLPWENRLEADVQVQHFGKLMVPIGRLSLGALDASIQFPNFMETTPSID